MKKKCGVCGETKEVAGYVERDYEAVKHIPHKDLLVEGKDPLLDDDLVGIPICKECYDELSGEET